MRSAGHARFSAADLAALQDYVAIVRAAVVRHWGVAVDALPSGIDDRGDILDSRLQSFGAGILSPREQIIVSLVLRGHSSGSVGLRLGIAEGTVKNHRKHIHAKLGISSQAELFALFIRHLREA
jgi:DNA-binding CsgD family transcriptional regulator